MRRRTSRLLELLAVVALLVAAVEGYVIFTRSRAPAPARTSAARNATAATETASAETTGDGRWVTGDYHDHTFLSDGERTEQEVVRHAFDRYGLTWFANSEHGEPSNHDAQDRFVPARPGWRMISDVSWPIISSLRARYPSKVLMQGVEWDVPTHEHIAVAIAADEPAAIADFTYMFEAADPDTSRPELTKDNTSHASAVRGVAWLQQRYAGAAWAIVNHPSREGLFSIGDLRELNDAAPDVCFGFEGIPGHQAGPKRGEYPVRPGFASTYGGADPMLAEVGGVWDALLGEGRRFWVFSGSDFHDPAAGDFWPGQYNVTHDYLRGGGAKDVVASLRSGEAFVTEGSLIDGLDFRASASGASATMGGTLQVPRGSDVTVTIRFHVPRKNANSDGPRVDHVDLIGGDVKAKAERGTRAFEDARNPTTTQLARFDESRWSGGGERAGWHEATYVIPAVEHDAYLRLRGTNLAPGVRDQTDAEGDPLSDMLVGRNDAGEAWRDLWFYSNPVFIDVR